MDITKELRELLQGSSLSRKEILSKLNEIDEKYNIMRDEVNDLYKENESYQKELDSMNGKIEELEKEILKGNSFTEQEILNEFKERFEFVKRCSLNPNLILHKYKAI